MAREWQGLGLLMSAESQLEAPAQSTFLTAGGSGQGRAEQGNAARGSGSCLPGLKAPAESTFSDGSGFRRGGGGRAHGRELQESGGVEGLWRLGSGRGIGRKTRVHLR